MDKKFLRLLIVCTSLAFVSLACALSGVAQTPYAASADVPSTMSASEEAAQQDLLATAQAQVLTTIIPAGEATQTAAVADSLSFEQRVATAVMQTQTAARASLSMEQQIQTAIAETQAASVAQVPLIQTAIAQTQAASQPLPVIQITPMPPISDAIFNGAYIYRYGFLGNNRYLITLQLSGNVSGSYYAVIEGQSYTCSVVADYPNRLYCTGPSVRGGSQTIYVYEIASNRLAYTGQVVLPQWTPTRAHYYGNYYYYTCSNCNSIYARLVTPGPVVRDNCKTCRGCNCPYYCNPYWHYQTCRDYYDENGKCYYFDEDGQCRYCKTGKKCR